MTTNFTKFGVIAGVSPDVQAFVVSSINQATQDLITQQGISQVGAVPQYVNTSGKTVLASPYTLPTSTGVDGQTLVVSGGNLVYGAGGGPTPTFINTLTVTNLYQGTSDLPAGQLYQFPTTVPPIDGNIYALTATDIGFIQPASINVAQSSPFSFFVQTPAGANNFNINFTLAIGVYEIPFFVEYVRSNIATAFSNQPNVSITFTFNFDTPTQRFYFFITSASATFSALNSAQISGGNFGNGLLGGNISASNQFVVSVSPIYYPNIAPTYIPSIVSKQLAWRQIQPVSDTLSSADGSSYIICTDVGIGGSVIGSQGNWNYGLGNLQNVGSISSTAETLTSTCGQSQLQLASIADGTSTSNTTYLSSGSGSMNTAFATTVGEALIVRDGGTGTVIRVNVGAETILKNALDRECVRVYDYGVQLKGEGQPLATGVRCAINLDGDVFLSREDPIFGNQGIFLAQGTDTRIWSPSTISEIDVDNNYIKLKRSNVEKLMVDDTGTMVSNAYYLPTAIGTIGQVLTQSTGTTSIWATPQIIGLYSQTSPATVVNTAVQTSIIGAGVGSLSIPANYFTTGMGFTYKTGGLFGSNNNDTIRFRLTNSGVLFDSGALQFSPSVASGRPWNIDVTFIYIGGTTMITNFNFQYNNGADARGFTAQNTNNTFNPAVINTLGFTAQWNNASNNNTITTNFGVMTKIY